MSKTSLLAVAFVLGATSVAHAGGQAGSIGLGAEFQLSGIGGASLNYDAGTFHVGGFLGFSDPPGDETPFDIGGRFFGHIHTTAMADFGVGGGLGIESVRVAAGQDRLTGLFLEPGFQIRLFLASNVALSFTGGISIGTIDAEGVQVTAQPTGTAGVHYYFF